MLKRLFFTIAFLLAALPVLAQQPGYFVAPDCGAVTGVANSTLCLQTTTASGRTAGRTYMWDGATWTLSAARSFSDLTGTASDAQVPDLNTLSTGLTNLKCVSVDGSGHLASAANDCAPVGPTGAQGPPGGGAIAIQYTFSTTTADADPGNGTLRLSNATQNAATTIRADLLDSGASDWTTVLDTLDASSSTVKGQVRLAKFSDQTKWLLFNLTARAAPAGYRNFTVANIGSSSASPFADGDAIIFTFTRTGDQGSATGLGDPGGNGVVVRTGLGVTTNRTITGTASEITVTNGDGTAGNPTLALHAAITRDAEAQSGALLWCSDAGANDTYTCGLAPALTAYTTGMCVAFKPNTNNTGAATVNIDSLGAKAIVTSANVALSDNALVAASIYTLCYDGTSFRMHQDATGAGATSADVQIFTATGANTWTKPASAKHVYVYLVGAGGGGGGGRRGAAASTRTGGAGGGGGAFTTAAFPASILGATETVSVGAAGSAGTAASVDSTNGGTGGTGGSTTFGAWRSARGGVGGGGASTSNFAGGVGEQDGGAGGNGGNAGETAGVGPGTQTKGAGGGAGGAGIDSTNVAEGGPAAGGAASSLRNTAIAGGTGGTSGLTCTAGGSVSNVTTNEATGGAGGGGGGARTSGGVGCGGAAGGLYGGGGGGGGASTNANNSGAGGAGANGIAIVVTVF
jgi:hypothetical protein